jgi:hypothetical protein
MQICFGIQWTILKDGKEITTDVMQHEPQDGSPFLTEIEWHPSSNRVDYFDVFSLTFFHLLKAKLLSLISTCQTHDALGTLHIG